MTSEQSHNEENHPVREQIIRKLIGCAIGLCLIFAVAGTKMGWPWYGLAALWIAALGGIVWATWAKPMPDWRDPSQKGAGPGLYEGSQYGGNTHEGGADGTG